MHMNTEMLSHREIQGVPCGMLGQVLRIWYAACTMPRHEKSVSRHMELRGVEHFLPCYSAKHRWKNGVVSNVELPLFPGYVFVRMDTRQRLTVLSIAGVHSILT